MMGDSTHETRAVFTAALALATSEERARYLDEACAGKPALRQRVEELLSAHAAADQFLEVNDPDQSTVTEGPGTIIGHYKLLEQIGEGGFGIVFLAEQLEPVRRRVALKIVKPGMDSKEVIARFEVERQALALMEHPNIARVFDAGVTSVPHPASGPEGRARHSVRAGVPPSESGAQGTDAPYQMHYGRPYFVMELVTGVPITEYCDANQLRPLERLELFLTVCDAVQHAHQKGIIHRDLKPTNILVTLHDGKPVPKVIDFGTAKALQKSLTEKTLFTAYGKLIGTPQYMSPEQAELSGLDVDTRADIYSLGVLLYELLTGTTPFEADRLRAAAFEEMLRIIRSEEPPKPSTRISTLGERATPIARQRQVDPALLRRTVQGDLDWIVMKALEKDRTRRYETASAFAEDIQRHLAHEPVRASPPGAAYRTGKFIQRHRIGVVMSTALGLALIGGLTATLIGFNQARHERDRAEAGEAKAQTEAIRSAQVAQFMKDMLKGAGPSEAMGRDTTMLREILDKTAERLSKDLSDQGEVEAELRSIIGEVYDQLGDYARAEEMHRRALGILVELRGNEHLDVARALDDVGGELFLQGKFAAAQTNFSQALDIRKKLLPEVHPKIALSLKHLGVVLQCQGNLTESESLHRRALAMRKVLFGSEHLDVAASHGALAWVLEAQNKLAESEREYLEELAIRKRLQPDKHPDVVRLLGTLAKMPQRRGELLEAETMFREALKVQQEVLGKDHPTTLATESALTGLLVSKGDYASAEARYREALEACERTLGREHPRTLFYTSGLASLLKTQGKLAEAVTLLRKTAEEGSVQGLNGLSWLLATGPDPKVRDGPGAVVFAEKAVAASKRKDPMIIDTLAAAYAEAGQFTNAVSAQQEAAALADDGLQKREFAVRLKLYEAGIAYHEDAAEAAQVHRLLSNSQFVEAEPLARDCLAIRRIIMPDDWRTFSTESMLGGSLLGQRKYPEAEPLLISGYNGMKEREQTIPAQGRPRLGEALRRLVELCEVTGRPEQAAEWRQKLAEFEQGESQTKPPALPH